MASNSYFKDNKAYFFMNNTSILANEDATFDDWDSLYMNNDPL